MAEKSLSFLVMTGFTFFLLELSLNPTVAKGYDDVNEGPAKESIEEITKPMNDMWYRRNGLQYVSQKQNGPIAGHYLKIDGTSVVAYALGTDPKSKLKVHSMLNNKLEKIVILESSNGGTALAINKADDTVFVKTLSKPLRSLTSLDQVKRVYPEILFKEVPREAGSEFFYLKSYLSGKRRILGFDKNGLPKNTSQVQPNSLESLFRAF